MLIKTELNTRVCFKAAVCASALAAAATETSDLRPFLALRVHVGAHAEKQLLLLPLTLLLCGSGSQLGRSAAFGVRYRLHFRAGLRLQPLSALKLHCLHVYLQCAVAMLADSAAAALLALALLPAVLAATAALLALLAMPSAVHRARRRRRRRTPRRSKIQK